jgi:hypothetical protein
VPSFATGIRRSRNEPAVGVEVLHGREALDSIDFEIDGKGVQASDPRNPEQTLNVIGASEQAVERAVERSDLGGVPALSVCISA